MKFITKQVVLALGGGGAKGLAHIGVLKCIEELGWEIGGIVGTSAGALVGGLYAFGYSADELLEIAREASTRKIFSPKGTKFLSGFVDDADYIQFLTELVGRVRIENLKLPFSAVAADIRTGKHIIITKGSLVTAIRASSAIPGIFSPVVSGDYTLVDGAVVELVPVEAAKKVGYRGKIVAVDVSGGIKDVEVELAEVKYPPQVDSEGKGIIKTIWEEIKTIFGFGDADESVNKGIFSTLLKSYGLTQDKLTYEQFKLNKPDYLLTPDVEGVSTFDFDKYQQMFESGYKEAWKVLGGKEIEQI